MGLLDFLTADYATRQQRTRDLNDRLEGLLNYYLGPTGIPDRLSSANALLNPIDQIGEAGANTVVAFDPTRSKQDRMQAALDAGLGTITAAAPAIGGAIAGQPARRALMETLVGASGNVDDAAARLASDIQARGGTLAADATGLGRGLLARDPEMIGEVFQPSGTARGLSADAPSQGFTLYHGSPHDFDRFSMDKIGTGEGAQAYGHGLYFTETPDIGRGYRDNVFGAPPRDAFSADEAHEIVSNQLQGFGATPNALHDATEDLRKSLSSEEASNLIWKDRQPRVDALKEAIAYLENKADTRLMVGDKSVSDIYDALSSRADRLPIKAAQANYDKMAILEDLMNDGDVLGVMQRKADYDPAALAWFEKEIAPNFKRSGALYEVNIKANPEDFLDWYAPLSEQPEILRRLGYSDMTEAQINKAAATIFDEARARGGSVMDYPDLAEQIDALNDKLNRLPPPIRGGELYHGAEQGGAVEILSTIGGGTTPAARSQELLSQGILGIRYPDAMSRGAGEGSRNYVVFDENLINIVRKYGIAGAAAMLGVSTMDVEQAMAQGAQPQQSGLLSPMEQ